MQYVNRVFTNPEVDENGLEKTRPRTAPSGRHSDIERQQHYFESNIRPTLVSEIAEVRPFERSEMTLSHGLGFNEGSAHANDSFGAGLLENAIDASFVEGREMSGISSFVSAERRDNDTASTSSRMKMPQHIILEVENHWNCMITDLQKIALQLTYKEVKMLGAFTDPPHSVSSVVGYIMILLGMKSCWKTARSSIFKEPFSLIKFMRDVEPMSMPVRRVKKAQKLFHEKICELDCTLIPVELRQFYRWAVAFSRIANIILKAESAKPTRQRKHVNKKSVANRAKSIAQVRPRSMVDRGFFDNEEMSVLSYFAALDMVGVEDEGSIARIGENPKLTCNQIIQNDMEKSALQPLEVDVTAGENASESEMTHTLIVEDEKAINSDTDEMGDNLNGTLGGCEKIFDGESAQDNIIVESAVEDYLSSEINVENDDKNIVDGVSSNHREDIQYHLRERENGVQAKNVSSIEDGGDDGGMGGNSLEFRVGDRIEANYRGRGRYYPGKIDRDNNDGTYGVYYDDGDRERNVRAKNIRLKG